MDLCRLQKIEMNMTMLKLIFTALIGIIAAPIYAQGASSELTPLKKIVNSSDFKTDPTRLSYAMKRCSAIYYVTGGVMMEKMGAKKEGEAMTEVAASYADGSSQLDQMIQKSRNPKSSKTADEWAKINNDAITRIMKIYLDDIKKSADRTGDYFSEDYKSDLTICNNFDKYTDKKSPKPK